MTTGKVSRLFIMLASALVCLSSASLVAQQSTVSRTAPRIVEAVDESRLTVLKGDTRPEARPENDRGRVSPNLVMGDLILVLRRSPEQQAAFEAFLNELQDSGSPQFHHWITPTQVGEQFGPAPSDIATVSNYLRNHGFSIDSVSKDRLTITFSGTAGQVETAFHTEIHNLQVNGEAHIANMSESKIPQALTPVVVGVKALHNFFPRPQHKTGSLVRRNSNGKWERIGDSIGTPKAKSVPAAANSRQITPLFNTGGTTSGAANIEDVVPYDFAAIYNVLPLWNASTPIDGTGQTIAIVGTSKILAPDVATFRSAFGLPVISSFSQVVANGTDPGVCNAPSGTANCTVDDEYENTLDVEWSGAVAKGAGIVLVVSGANSTTTDTVFTSSSYIVNHATATIMNVSYGECELALGTSGNAAYNTLWSTAYAAGIAVFVSSGDQGSATCDAGGSAQFGNPYGAQYGLSISGLSSTPYNTSVGGTDFSWGWTNSQATYWNTTNDAHLASAKGYIPEFPWNSTCSNPLYVDFVNSQLSLSLTAGEVCDQIAQGQITSTGSSLLGLVDTVGGGGGKSACTTNSTTSTSTSIDPASCSGGYAKPSWQTGVTGIPTDGKRDIPDISFFAASGFSGSSYVVCVTNAGACSYTAGTEPSGEEVGGTSVSSPAMAGVMALINQKTGKTQGNPNVQLYQIAAQETYSGCVSDSVPVTGSACVFNDITTGTIAMPCVVSSPDCTGTGKSGDQFGILAGYASTAGYDLATGLGSMNVANLINAYAAAVAPGFKLTASTVTAAPGAGGTSTISATGTGGYVGTITLSSCVLATSPTGAVDVPTCAIGTSTITIASGSTTGQGTVTFSTTAASAAGGVAEQEYPGRWTGAGGIAVAGLFLLFGIPARNRKWRSMLGVFLCLAALGVLSGCGGGSSTPKNPGTTAGAYTYTVTGTDANGLKATATVTLNVS